MFTGIIEDVGLIRAITHIENGLRVTINSKLSKELRSGDSIAVNGACLTVTDKNNEDFSVDVSFETINRTNFSSLTPNSHVNLERALKLSDRLDGHIVLGHIDTTATMRSLNKIGEFYILSVNIDKYTFDHSVEKGSIAINGISLTISNLTQEYLDVAIIPFTYENTNLKYSKIGEKLNIEVDIIGKYIEKFTKKPNGLTEEFLKQHGFT